MVIGSGHGQDIPRCAAIRRSFLASQVVGTPGVVTLETREAVALWSVTPVVAAIRLILVRIFFSGARRRYHCFSHLWEARSRALTRGLLGDGIRASSC